MDPTDQIRNSLKAWGDSHCKWCMVERAVVTTPWPAGTLINEARYYYGLGPVPGGEHPLTSTSGS